MFVVRPYVGMVQFTKLDTYTYNYVIQRLCLTIVFVAKQMSVVLLKFFKWSLEAFNRRGRRRVRGSEIMFRTCASND